MAQASSRLYRRPIPAKMLWIPATYQGRGPVFEGALPIENNRFVNTVTS